MLNVILYSYFTQDIVEGNAINALWIEKVFKAIIELLADKVKITYLIDDLNELYYFNFHYQQMHVLSIIPLEMG